ncbi:acyl-CoA dehydrogenase family protein [Actinocorallia sp. A-T 12471]|uniref:acyl-CoA dehydrogenase family protein n=1 Tax=Actinocorallia sp. A-T 12471 TaxID=3089813 RepID=UPI0029CE8B50|nr:acyl-CoA dehydrogenase family protein [Actinocorallia sp. A-T 12471]MDX6741193.1 acyl-CoA dehydrogenase family protein [Actinocorallia sp. A-T 12471]
MTTSIETTTTPDTAELVARARALRPLLSANAAQGEKDRRVPDESIKAMKDAGLFRILQPKRYGGYETSMRALVDVSAAVGEADGGTAWVVSLLNSGAWIAGCFPTRAQDDVWGANPDALVSGVFSPQVTSKKVPGGFRLTGKWFYNSGSLHADWAVLSMPVTDEAGEVVDMAMVLVPRTDVDVDDTWYVAGMRASGSNCLVADDVFVPEHRLMSVGPAIEGVFPTEHTEETLYQSPLGPLFSIGMVGPQLGLGRAALEMVTAKATTKGIAHTVYTRQADSVAVQIQLAQATMLLDTAHFHAYHVTDELDSAAAEGRKIDFAGRAKIRAHVGFAIENVVKAIDTLLYAHGSGAFAEVNPLQRIWRDSEVASRHAGILPMLCYEIYGKSLVGSEERITPMI